MTPRRPTFRERFYWAKPFEFANPRRAYLPLAQDEDAVYRGSLHGRRLRLLRILPQSTPDSLQYDIDEYGLDSRVRFEALSYSWGDPAAKYTITCNGKKVQIAENLYSALQQFQEDGNHPLLWTDALCINQADLDEKTEQVKLMAEIYKIASEVIVWLGKEQPTDRSGVEMLSLLLEKLGLPEYGKDLIPDPRYSHEAFGLPEGGDQRWMDLLGIFKRPWFIRAWTVQELLFAKKSHIRIGRMTVSWDQIFAVSLNSSRYPDLNTTLYGPRVANQELSNVRNLWVLKVSFAPFLFSGTSIKTDHKVFFLKAWALKSVLFLCTSVFKLIGLVTRIHLPSWANSKPNLNDLLLATAGHETTTPQDKVFSVLALTHDGRVDKIDYRKDMAEVLMDATKMSLGVEDNDLYIPLGASLRFLTSIEAPSTIPGVPSWVPDYSPHSEFRVILETGSGTVSMTQLSLNNVAGMCDGKFLGLRGRFIDIVSTVYHSDAHEHRIADRSAPGKPLSNRDIAEIYTSAPDVPREVLLFEEGCWNLAKSLGTYPTGETVKEAYWKAMVCDMVYTNEGMGLTMEECFEAYHEAMPMIVLLPGLFAEFYGLELKGPSSFGHGRSELDAPPEGEEDVGEFGNSKIGDEASEIASEERLTVLPSTSDTAADKQPIFSSDPERPSETPFKLSRAVTGLIGEIPAKSALANDIALQDPLIEPPSRTSTFQDMATEIAEASTSAFNRFNSDSPLISPATPEMFTSVGLRVPKTIYLHPNLSLLEHLEPLNTGMEVFEQRMQLLSCKRRFGTTQDGYMGWFPRGARDGDVICVFNGSTIPFVVRKSEEEGGGEWDGTWKFVGACFVRGFMNAGAWAFAREEVTIVLS